MPKQRPFSIKIFLPDGNPEGLRVIDKSNWTGTGIVFNRSIYQEARERHEFNKTGVYVLVGTAPDTEIPRVYIGEGDPLKQRLESHYANKDFWTWGIFFVTKDDSLNKAHVQYLESHLIELARKTKLCILDNSQIPQKPTLTEPEKADVEGFLLDMLNIFPLVGLSVFIQVKKIQDKNNILIISSKGLSGTGYESPNGFVVCKGTETPLKEGNSIDKSNSILRKDLVKQGVLVQKNDKYEFSQDYNFSSPSTAAAIVLARSANGRTEWKDNSGRTLKQIQTDAANIK